MGKLCCYVVFSLIITMASAEIVIQTDRGLLQVDSIVESNNETHHVQERSLTPTFGPHSTYLANSGLTCYVCYPGFYKKSDCTSNGTTAVCGRCPNGQYSTTYNIAIRCAYCSPQCIDKKAVVHSPCNSTGDISCQCKKGYYNHSKGGGEWICLPHSTCPAGTEIGSPGTVYQDTHCTPCSVDTFSPESSLDQCTPCTICDSNKFIKTKCNGITDTVCENKEEDNLTLKIVLPIVIVVVVVVVVGLVVVYLWRNGTFTKFKKWRRSSSKSEEVTEIGNLNNNDQMISSGNEENQRAAAFPAEANIIFMLGNEGDQETARPTAIENTLPPNTENCLWVKVFKTVSNEINIEQWRSVIRLLLANYYDAPGVERKIEEICYDNKHYGINETIYQCLLAWSKLTDEAYLDDIISSLVAHDMLGLADNLNRQYASLLDADNLNRQYASLLEANRDEGECDLRDQE